MNQIDPARAAAQRAALAEQMAAKAAMQAHQRQHGHAPHPKAGWTSTLIVIGVIGLAILSFIAMVMRG
jgi:hypothetical protein